MKQENIQRGIKKMEEKTHIIPLLLEEKKMLLFVIIPSELFLDCIQSMANAVLWDTFL